jgi:spermidine/putrescine transport system substrate-binding protein
VADQDRDAFMARMAQTKVNRRSFLAAAGLIGGGAALAACTGNSGTSAAPASAAAEATASPEASVEASAAPSAAASYAIEDELWMLNWSGYVDPGNMETFKAEYGIKNFQYDIFANNEELMAKLSGGATGYDMACPTAEFIPQMAEQGYIQKLDFSRIPNFKYIDPAILSQKWDPNNEYHVPKDFGTTGILYRSKIVKEPITSWKEFYDLSVGKYSGKVVIVDSLGDVLAMPLKMLGFSINSTDLGELDQAKKLLLDLAPHVLALDSDTYQDKLASEEAVLCLGWTGPLLALRADPKTADTKYVVPSEGTLFWLDTWVMMADAPHPNATYAWFDYVERPAIQAIETKYTGYGTPNTEAVKLLPKEVVDDPSIFPPADVMKNLEGADPTVTDNADRLAVWTEFKSSIGK